MAVFGLNFNRISGERADKVGQMLTVWGFCCTKKPAQPYSLVSGLQSPFPIVTPLPKVLPPVKVTKAHFV